MEQITHDGGKLYEDFQNLLSKGHCGSQKRLLDALSNPKTVIRNKTIAKDAVARLSKWKDEERTQDKALLAIQDSMIAAYQEQATKKKEALRKTADESECGVYFYCLTPEYRCYQQGFPVRVKIGSGKNITKRLRRQLTSAPDGLVLLKTLSTSLDERLKVEKEVRKAFPAYSNGGGKEWVVATKAQVDGLTLS